MVSVLNSKQVLIEEIDRLVSLYQEAWPYETEHTSSEQKKWMLDIEETKKNIDLFNELELEAVIQQLTMKLRLLFMLRGQHYSNPHMKSPSSIQPKAYLPSQKRISYSYERNIQADELELRAGDFRERHEEWTSDHVMFSSGMAALSTFLQSLFAMTKPTSENPLRIRVWGDYFETRVLTDLYRRDSVSITNYCNKEQGDKVDMANVYLIEPVRYNWELEVFDFSELIESLLGHQPSTLTILLLDTTLSGSSTPIYPLLDQLKTIPNIAVVQVHSCLKLDQQGLELSNAGLLSFYTCTNSPIPKASEFCTYIRKVRTILGAGLSFEEMCLLDTPFFLNRDFFKDYCEKVYKNNEDLASINIGEGSIFRKIAFPSSSSHLQGKAPFVVFHLSEDCLDNYGLILGVLEHEANRRNLSFEMGSSFGFRNHRFEVIIPNVSEGKGLLKVAMGYREGPSKQGIISLFRELANVLDFKELRETYSHVSPVELTSIS